jgi:hypothetical protein
MDEPRQKKARLSADSAVAAAEETKSPMTVYWELMKAVQERDHMIGSAIVAGIEREEDEDEDEGEDENEDKEDKDNEREDERENTAEEVGRLRYFLLNESRIDALKKYETMVTCGQEDDGIMMFDTSSGNNTIMETLGELDKIRKLKAPAQIDHLFALTLVLQSYDYWAIDNEYGGEGGELNVLIKSLAKMWKLLLKKTDAQLGIDPEFSRPAIEALMEKFAETVESSETPAFNWK